MNSMGRNIHCEVCSQPGPLGPGGSPWCGDISILGSTLSPGRAAAGGPSMEPVSLYSLLVPMANQLYGRMGRIASAIFRFVPTGNPHATGIAVGSRKSYYSLAGPPTGPQQAIRDNEETEHRGHRDLQR